MEIMQVLQKAMHDYHVETAKGEIKRTIFLLKSLLIFFVLLIIDNS
jgi:hypothetical protein